MTTGRINQVTVRRARPAEGNAHDRVLERRLSHPVPGQSLSPIDFRLSPRRRPAALLPSRTSRAAATPRFQVPRSHKFQRRSPGPADRSRPLRRRLPANGRLRKSAGCQDAADPRLTKCKAGLAKGNQSTSLSIARNSRKRTLQDYSQAPRAQSPAASRASVPIPSGYILQGRRINRSVQGWPANPSICRTGAPPAASGGAKSTSLRTDSAASTFCALPAHQSRPKSKPERNRGWFNINEDGPNTPHHQPKHQHAHEPNFTEECSS
jgi:hypothetical protein